MRLAAAAAAADDLIAEIRLVSRLLSIQVSSDDASGSILVSSFLLFLLISLILWSFLRFKVQKLNQTR